jgi:L-seryl-tRNA(Ser) seleniumtransferase
VALVVLTRLAVTYDILPREAIETIVRFARGKGALVYVDDAGGARVGPAAFDQPRMLELGVDVGATGLDKYGTRGPRFGLLAGRRDLVGRIRAKGFEFGMEARQMLYPAVVRTLEQYDPAAGAGAYCDDETDRQRAPTTAGQSVARDPHHGADRRRRYPRYRDGARRSA